MGADGRMIWVQGARPRTLGAAVVPVVVDRGWRRPTRPTIWWRAAAALVVALVLQIGVNYANDYSDGVRGTDADRRGPMRLTATGVATPSSVRTAAMLVVRGRRGGRPRAVASRSTCGCSSSASRRSPPPRSTPAGHARTATRASARSRCCASSGSSRRSGRCTSSSNTFRRRRGPRRSPSGSLPSRFCSRTTCATSRPTAVAGKLTLAVRIGAARTRSLFVVAARRVARRARVALGLAHPWALLGLARRSVLRRTDQAGAPPDGSAVARRAR